MRPTWAEINLDSLIHNFGTLKALIGPGVAVLSVVKADAYGHGAVEVAGALAEAGTDMLGVATVEEAVELRDYGLELPILLLGGIRPEEAWVAVEHSLTPTIYSIETAKALDYESARAGKRTPYHLKIDTGMARLGVDAPDAGEFAAALAGYTNIYMEGVFTHLSSAFLETPETTNEQLALFGDAVRAVRENGHSPAYAHSANSVAAVRFPASRMDLVRPGIILYGAGVEGVPGLKPVMKLKTRIIQLKKVPKGTKVSYGGTYITEKPSVIATLPIGYADGYARSHSNRARVSVKGGLAPVAGAVCMDLTMIDVTGIPGAAVGDEVVLFGDENVSADAAARWADTISYEVLSTTGKRIPRRYV